jgi:hypothetical protein
MKDKFKKEKKKIENQQRLNRIKEILQITEGANDGQQMWKNFVNNLPRGKKKPKTTKASSKK